MPVCIILFLWSFLPSFLPSILVLFWNAENWALRMLDKLLTRNLNQCLENWLMFLFVCLFCYHTNYFFCSMCLAMDVILTRLISRNLFLFPLLVVTLYFQDILLSISLEKSAKTFISLIINFNYSRQNLKLCHVLFCHLGFW